MANLAPQFLEIGADAGRRRVAVIAEPGREPGLVWLPGFKSDMVSTKATALADWARARGQACTRFDYSGHGQSEGRFEDGTIGRWLEEAESVFRRSTQGRQVVIGSSMGGYLALLLLRRLMDVNPDEAARVAALILIAPAWNMTEELMWREFPDSVKRQVEDNGVYHRPSQYGEPYPITRGLIEEGRNHLLPRAPWDPKRPVHIIHGLQDPDVPWEHTLDLASWLNGSAVEVSAVPDGEHRLSRPEDIAMLIGIVEKLSDGVKA